MLKVILVEDEYVVRMGMQTMVEWEKHNFQLVGVFCHGKQAMDYLSLNEVDIVITDVRMPIMDGIELCKQIRQRKYLCDIVIVSSYNDFEYAKQAMVYGALDYLHKPELTPENIIETLDRVSNKRRAEQEKSKQLRLYDESYTVIRKNAIRRMFGKHDTSLFSQLLQDSRCAREMVGTVLIAGHFFIDTNENSYALSTVARYIHDQDISDGQVISVMLENGMIAVFFFGSGFKNFCDDFPDFEKKLLSSDNFTKQAHLKFQLCKSSILSFPPVPLHQLAVEFEKYLLDATAKTTRLNQQNPIVSQALAIINEEYCSQITLAAVADKVHVTPSYLSRLLLSEYGENFIDLLSSLRISKAKELLLSTDLDVEHITEMVGYKNSKYFIRAFKKLSDTTPGQYRKQMRNSKNSNL